jgi:hypothetical protein
VIPVMRRPRGRPATTQAVHLPAPIGGLNTISAGTAMPASDCVQLYNLVAAEYGLRSRLGSREWCTGLTGAGDNQVRTIVPFTGSAKNGSKDKLFAVTSTGIWDVSSSTSTPTQVLTFATQSGDAGQGISHVVVTAGGHFLLYCDEENGLHVYTESTNTWAAVTMGIGAGQISGVDPAKLVFVNVFKSNVWFVERDSARAWYLDAGAIYGTAHRFDLATKFRAGGTLLGLWNWTLDGGAGIDDSLVAISGGGDVVIYQGTDPSSASAFGLKGVWYAPGGVPYGRRIASDIGGDVLILTRVGALPLSRLVAGGSDDRSQYATAKIGPLFNQLMMTRATLRGWSVRMHPEDNALILTVPEADGQPTTQLAMAMSNRSWSRYRDLPILSSEVWGGKLYFGTVDGRVCINDGYVDGITLADPNTYTPVQYAMLGAFQNLGNGRMKRVQMIRPTILSESFSPSYQARAKYRFDLTELAPVSVGTNGRGSWDTAVFDTDVWAGEYQATQAASGASGMGVDVAIALRGTATSRTVVVGFDVMFDQGGML